MLKFLKVLPILTISFFSLLVISNSVNAAPGFALTISGSTTGNVYTNGSQALNVSWSWQEAGGTSADLFIDSSTTSGVKSQTGIASSSVNIQSLISDLSEGTYTIRVISKPDNHTSALRTLIMDKTLPTISPTTLIIKNSSGTAITDLRSNSTSVNIVLPVVSDDHFGDDFLIEVALGTGTLSYNTITANNYSIAGGEATVNIGAAGLNLTDNTVNFRVRARDLAGNVSTTSATGKFILDRTAPPSPTNLQMKDGTEVVANGATRKGVTELTWTAPANTTDISHYNVYVRSGLSVSNYVLIGSGSSPFSVNTTGFANGTIFFKVQTVDTAGNFIPEADLTPVSFILNRRNVSFDIRYFASVSSGYLTVSGVSAINSSQRETLIVIDNEPLIASYAIGTTDINNDSYTFKPGDRAALEAELRSLTGSPDNGYYVVIRDAAANSAKIRLNLQQVGPTLPVNRTLTITSVDTKDTIGITSTVRIAFDVATGADYYKVLVNGEEANIASSGAGFVEVSLNTIAFGNVENEYELRAFTNAGNFVSYQRRTHITPDLVKPYAVINHTTSRVDSINFNLTLNDQNNRLTQVQAVLYLNNVEVQRQPVQVGTRNYTFSGLLANRTNYQIRILGAFSFNNTPFPNTTVINPGTVYNLETLRTSPDIFVTIDSYDVSFNNIVLRLTSTKRTTASFSYEIKVYEGDTLVVTTPASAVVTNDGTVLVQSDSRTLAGLVVGKNYQARITDGNIVLGTVNFVTTKRIPTATLDVTKTDGRSLDVAVNVSDPDGAILTSPTKATLRVYNAQGTTLLHSANIDVVNSLVTVPIPNLNPDTSYVFRVFTSYRIDDTNNVNNNLLAEATFRTAKLAPTVNVTWSDFFDVTDRSITFDVNLEDPFTTLIESNVILYRLDQRVGDPIAINRGRFSNLVFSGLQSNTQYVIVIQVRYDLNDGAGVVVKDGYLQGFPTTFFRSPTFTTHKSLPDIEVLSSGVTNQSATIRVQLIDTDTTFTAGSVRLFAPGVTAPIATRVLTTRAETFVFDNLNPDIAYEIVVEADYDINDGRGLRTRQRIFDAVLKTDPNIGATIAAPVIEPTTIRVPITLVDYVNVNAVAKLFQGNLQIGENILLQKGSNTIIFSELEPLTIYRIAIEYTSGVSIQLAERTIQTTRLQALATPTVSLSRIVVSENTLQFSAVVVDTDNAIDDLITVSVCNQMTNECQVLERSVQDLTDGIQVSVTAAAEYTVSLQVSYDLLTTTGTAESEVRVVRVEAPAEEPTPTPEPTPDPTPTPEPTPRDPIDLNLGVVLASLIGAVAIGFVGLFYYSFRRFYLG